MYFYIFILILLILVINKSLITKNFLTSMTGDVHQKFTSNSKVPLTGGIFIFSSYLFFFSQDISIFFLATFIILILGFFSDLQFIKSATTRFLLQTFLVLIFVIFMDIKLNETRVIILDQFITNSMINYFFITFCILILLNGSNFIDGLNTLSIGYYLLISIILYYLTHYQNLDLKYLPTEYLVLILTCMFFLNMKNKIYLGDSGSYLLGFSFAVFLIEIYNSNLNISPFFIILLVWYPCYENLFSIIRKRLLKRSPMSPDTNHFHQLIFFMIKKRYKTKSFFANLAAAQIINFFHIIIFSISVNFIRNTEIQVALILLNVFMYTIIYFKAFFFKHNKKISR